jgi:hypothetical protein
MFGLGIQLCPRIFRHVVYSQATGGTSSGISTLPLWEMNALLPDDYGWQWTWPLVLGSGQGPLCWAFQCLLQIAGTSDVDRWLLAQPTRTAVYGPVRTVVWQGSAGDRRPYANLTSKPGNNP